MKKKVLSVVLMTSLISTLFAGCGSTGSTDTASSTTTTSETATDATTIEAASDVTATTEAAASTSTETTGERPEVRVLIKWAEEQLPNWQEKVDEYNADTSNPITISLEFYGSDGYDDKVKSELTSDDPPQVVQLMKTVFNDYAANGQLTEIGDFIKDQGWDYNEGALAWAGPLNNPDGGVYGIPDFSNTSCIFYNTKLFDKLGIKEPTNVDELKAAAKTLNDNGYKAIVTGANNWCASDLLAKVQAQSVGSDLLVKAYNNEAKYNDSSMVDALTEVDDLVKANVIDPSSADYGDDEAIAEFVMGNAGMYTAHTAMTGTIDSMKDSDFEYNVIQTMDFVDNPKTAVAVTWGSMWCIPSNVKDVDAAKDALAFLFSEDMMKSQVEDVGRIVNVDSWNSGLTHPALVTASKQLADSGTADSFYLLDMVSSKVLDNMNKGIQEMIQGKQTPQEVMDNVQKTWDDEQSQK